MADLTANASLRFFGEITSEVWTLNNSASQTIYTGHPMILDISADTVYARGYVDATTVAADDIFLGIALAPKAVATADTEVDNTLEIATQPTIVGFAGSVFTDADVGDTMYMSDSSTLSATAADNPQLGVLVRVEDGYQYVRLASPVVTTGA